MKKLFVFVIVLSFVAFGINIIDNVPFASSTVISESLPVASSQSQETASNFTDSADLNENLTVHYIDVGQADSILIELPNSQTMLIDGGNRADGAAVVNYLQDNGVTTIDYLIATHPHEDHIGGLPDVINSSIEIESIYMPRVGATTRIFEDLLTSIENEGLKINTAQADVNILSIPDLQIDIIAPVGNAYSDLNDWSAVIKLKYKDTTFLFMGDAERISENQIYADIDADVLKVGHHGSRSSTSASFLQKITPDYAVICVGKDNSYGHPNDTTLATLNNSNVEVFRTDELGTIIITSDGDNIRVNKESIPYSPNAPPTSAITPSTSNTAPSHSAQGLDLSENHNITVYVTKTGEKYHRYGCRYLRSRIPISLENARRSYEPCSLCNPPR